MGENANLITLDKEVKDVSEESLVDSKQEEISKSPELQEKGSDKLPSHTQVKQEDQKEFTPSYKSRLFVGEGDFSYTRALIEKHQGKGRLFFSKLVATELSNSDVLLKTYQTFEDNISFIRKCGVTIMFAVDARRLHEHPELKDKNFKRIHFNFPHDKSDFKKQRSLPIMIANFFRSAAILQKDGDKVHVAIPKCSDNGKDTFYQGYIYGIYEAARDAGYILKKKRQFGDKRYPGYKHKITGKDESAEVAQEAREYVFVKTNMPFIAIEKSSSPKKSRAIDYTVTDKKVYVEIKGLPIIDTDNDSSDYIESDVDLELKNVGGRLSIKD